MGCILITAAMIVHSAITVKLKLVGMEGGEGVS